MGTITLRAWHLLRILFFCFRESLEGKVSSLEAAQNLLVDHKMELKNTIESLQSTIEREKKLVLEAQEEASKNAKAKDDIITAMKSQLVRYF